MKKITVFLVVALTGCGVAVDMKSKQIEWAEKVCANNGGVKTIVFQWGLAPSATCNNGAYFNANFSDLEAIEGYGR